MAGSRVDRRLTENRLSDDDRFAMRSRMAEAVHGWKENGARAVRYADVPSLVRLGVHAIGCSEADLREPELDEVRTMALSFEGPLS